MKMKENLARMVSYTFILIFWKDETAFGERLSAK